MGAVGAWLGAPLTLVVFLLSAVLGLLSVIVVITGNAIAKASTADSAPSTGRGDGNQVEAARHRIPYAVPVALATWLVVALKLIALQA
jgi:Flp pilus assembly protein protease CpaA